MQDPKELRERAARFLDLVLIAHQRGDIGLAGILAEEVSALTGGGRRSRRRPDNTAFAAGNRPAERATATTNTGERRLDTDSGELAACTSPDLPGAGCRSVPETQKTGSGAQ
jgi:hypothetical protein